MRKIIGLCLLATTLFTSGAFAQNLYKIETMVGIGATLEKLANGTVQVDALIPNAPAERIGMAVGDIITEVKSLPTTTFVDVRKLTLPDIVELIRGPIGVPVELSVTRGSSKPMEVSIIREKFEVDDGT